MPLWIWVFLVATLIKLTLAGLMLWIPFRNDNANVAQEGSDSSEDDGGSHALPGGPLDPHPRRPLPHLPRRGPHGSPSPPSPARVRTRARRPVYSSS